MTEADKILEAVCEAAGVEIKHLLSDRRARLIARPRQLAMALIAERTPLSLPQIGRKMGGRDHTTVMHAKKAWAQAIERGEPGMAEMQARAEALLDVGKEPEPEATPTVAAPASVNPALPPVSGLKNKNVLRALHRVGAWADIALIADESGVHDNDVGSALKHLHATGHVRKERKHEKRQRWTATHDVTGQPCAPTRDARYPHGLPPAERRCNRCRRPFAPKSRYNFRCDTCDGTVCSSPEYNAAPGMEMMV
jgi:hypothetical protein